MKTQHDEQRAAKAAQKRMKKRLVRLGREALKYEGMFKAGIMREPGTLVSTEGLMINYAEAYKAMHYLIEKNK